jgi:hypothetical protein
MILDDAVDDGQAQPGYLADFLGCEERIENTVGNGRINAVARIRYGKLDIPGSK